MLALSDEQQKDWAGAGHEWVKVDGGQALKDIDFTLVKGGVIRGKVITADTAETLPNVGIGVQGPAHPQSSASIQRTETSPDGTYAIRVPPGQQHVYVQGPVPEAYRQPNQDIRDVKVGEGETVRLDFRLQRREGDNVDGVVIGLDGKPAAGVTVTARSDRGMFNNSMAKTDAAGKFHFDALPSGTALEVKMPDVGTAQPVTTSRGQGQITLQLVRRIKLTLPGLVTDEDDKPIPNAKIQLTHWYGNYGMGSGARLASNANGRYEIPDLYIDSEYYIAADADGFDETQVKLEMDANMKQLPTLKLQRATGITSGVVVDQAGNPVPGIIVRLDNGTSPKTAVTDAQGRFSFHVVPGKQYRIVATPKDPRARNPFVRATASATDLKIVLPNP